MCQGLKTGQLNQVCKRKCECDSLARLAGLERIVWTSNSLAFGRRAGERRRSRQRRCSGQLRKKRLTINKRLSYH